MYPLYFLLRFVLMVVHWRRSRAALAAIRRYDALQKQMDTLRADFKKGRDTPASFEENAVHFMEVAQLSKELKGAEAVWTERQGRADRLTPVRSALAEWSSRNMGYAFGLLDAAKVAAVCYYWSDICAFAVCAWSVTESAWTTVQNLL